MVKSPARHTEPPLPAPDWLDEAHQEVLGDLQAIAEKYPRVLEMRDGRLRAKR